MGRKRHASSGPTKTATLTANPRTGRRALRARPTPRWLTGRQDLDDVARRRCLMLLSVLSGEKPVTEVITAAGLSRGTYYQLETKALAAMLQALAPGADGVTTADGASPAQRIADLEAKVGRLEQEKRRLERLLYLARKVVPDGPLTTGVGRPRRILPASTSGGRRPLPSSAATTKAATPAASTPTPGGATTP